jgi:hypothetical protein
MEGPLPLFHVSESEMFFFSGNNRTNGTYRQIIRH